MSVCSVVPDCSISSAARRVPMRTISGDTVFAFGREDVLLEPVHQCEVVGQTAVHDHGRMAMRVDEAGQHDRAVGVDDVGGGVPSRNRLGRVHLDNRRSVDRDRSRRDDAPRGVHGDHRPAGHHQRCTALRGRRGAEHGNRQDEREDENGCAAGGSERGRMRTHAWDSTPRRTPGTERRGHCCRSVARFAPLRV